MCGGLELSPWLEAQPPVERQQRRPADVTLAHAPRTQLVAGERDERRTGAAPALRLVHADGPDRTAVVPADSPPELRATEVGGQQRPDDRAAPVDGNHGFVESFVARVVTLPVREVRTLELEKPVAVGRRHPAVREIRLPQPHIGRRLVVVKRPDEIPTRPMEGPAPLLEKGPCSPEVGRQPRPEVRTRRASEVHPPYSSPAEVLEGPLQQRPADAAAALSWIDEQELQAPDAFAGDACGDADDSLIADGDEAFPDDRAKTRSINRPRFAESAAPELVH